MLGRLEKMRNDVPKAIDKAIYTEALRIFRKSQRIVPVDKGFLKASGVIEGPTNHEVLIGYGGPAASYALYVHEDPDAKHKAGKSYKYLETPFMEALAGMEKRLAQEVEKIADGASPEEIANESVPE
jgi:hypothetical protein